MPSPTWNLEFLNHNMVRRYPLAEDATGEDTTGSVQLPNSFLVELDLPIHAAMDMDQANFFIRLVGIYSTGYMLTVAYDGTDGVVDVATAMIPKYGHTRFKKYALGGVEPFDDVVGKVLIGDLTDIDEQPPGLWEFTVDAARIEPDSIRPNLRGVQGLIAVNGSQRSARLTGDVELVAGTNIQITPILVEGENPRLQISAISGEGTIQGCACEDANTPCIRRIDGVRATADGRFFILGDNCVEVQTAENGLKLVDKCCQPCCSCTELEAITADLERFNTQRSTLELFLNNLMTAVNQMELVVLGARLGDRGCVQCE